jgi:hypothetical protein
MDTLAFYSPPIGCEESTGLKLVYPVFKVLKFWFRVLPVPTKPELPSLSSASVICLIMLASRVLASQVYSIERLASDTYKICSLALI